MTNWFTRIHHRFISQLMSQGVWKNSTPKSTPMMLPCYPCTVSIAHYILSKTVLWRNLRFEDDMIEEYYWHCPIYIGYGIDINKIWFINMIIWCKYMLIYHRYLTLLIFLVMKKYITPTYIITRFRLAAIFCSMRPVTSTFFFTWNSAMKFFCHSLRLPVGPVTS